MNNPVEEAKQLLERITPGEWKFHRDLGFSLVNDQVVKIASPQPNHEQAWIFWEREEDKEFIANSPRLVRQLVEEVEIARNEAEQWKAPHIQLIKAETKRIYEETYGKKFHEEFNKMFVKIKKYKEIVEVAKKIKESLFMEFSGCGEEHPDLILIKQFDKLLEELE